MKRKTISRAQFYENAGALFDKFLETSRREDYEAWVEYISVYKPEDESDEE